MLFKVTTRGADLEDLVPKCPTGEASCVQTFVNDLVSVAGVIVKRLVTSTGDPAHKLDGPTFEKVVCMLLEEQYKDGVPETIADEYVLRCFFLGIILITLSVAFLRRRLTPPSC